MLPINQIRAAVSNQTLDTEKRTVEVVWSTGYKGLRSGWSGKYYEELSMDPAHVDLSRLNAGAPLLNTHNSSSIDGVIGIVESARIENGKGMATVRFGKDEEAQKVFEKVQDGILRNISVGYNVAKYENVTGPNDKIETYRAVSWSPAELSIVPVGFDPHAQIRENESLTMNEVEIVDTRSQQQKETVMSEQKPQPQVDTEALKKEAIEAERKRVTEIRKAVKDAQLSELLADDMIERGLALEDAKRNIQAFQKATQESEASKISSTVRVEVGTDDLDKKREAIANATLARHDSRFFQLDKGNTYGGYSFLRAMESIVKRGPGESDASFAKRVMSSSDLPLILANVAEKSALKRYELAPRTWSRWAQSKALPNYKQHSLLRAGDFASLSEKQEGGEYTVGSFSENQELVQLKEYGKMMKVTRRMLINDDLGMVPQVLGEGGVAAARLENRLVYAVLTGNPTMSDSVALFHSSHANLGTPAAISDTTIGEAFQLMKEQSSLDGLDKLNLSPQYMICGPQSEVIARKYLSVISPTQASNVNVFSGALELIVDAEISTNDYFFACNPAQCETISLYRLQGEEQPQIESRVSFETDDLEIKVRHSAAAAPADFRGLVKNANAS